MDHWEAHHCHQWVLTLAQPLLMCLAVRDEALPVVEHPLFCLTCNCEKLQLRVCSVLQIKILMPWETIWWRNWTTPLCLRLPGTSWLPGMDSPRGPGPLPGEALTLSTSATLCCERVHMFVQEGGGARAVHETYEGRGLSAGVQALPAP